MRSRVLTGILIGASLLALFLLGNFWVLVVFAVALYLLAQDEFRLLAKAGGLSVEPLALPLCGVAYLLATAAETPLFKRLYAASVPPPPPTPVSEALLWLSPALFLILLIFRRRTEKALERFALTLTSFWYLAVLLGFLVRIVFQFEDLATGRLVLIYGLTVIKFADTGAYFIGMRYGRNGRKLIPEISPAKSVAGLWGAYLFSIAVSLLFALGADLFHGGTLGAMPLSYLHAAVLGAVLATAGCLGDLAESLFKRSVAIKDSSARFPGIGGFLDMIDSPLFAAPFLYLYLRLFL